MTARKRKKSAGARSTRERRKPASSKDEIAKAEIAERVAWFEGYVHQLETASTRKGPDGGPYRCPCCGSKTLPERGGFDICPVCFWEDDGQDDQDADVVRGGPNGAISLTQARLNYKGFGACERRMLPSVRKPKRHER